MACYIGTGEEEEEEDGGSTAATLPRRSSPPRPSRVSSSRSASAAASAAAEGASEAGSQRVGSYFVRASRTDPTQLVVVSLQGNNAVAQHKILRNDERRTFHFFTSEDSASAGGNANAGSASGAAADSGGGSGGGGSNGSGSGDGSQQQQQTAAAAAAAEASAAAKAASEERPSLRALLQSKRRVFRMPLHWKQLSRTMVAVSISRVVERYVAAQPRRAGQSSSPLQWLLTDGALLAHVAKLPALLQAQCPELWPILSLHIPTAQRLYRARRDQVVAATLAAIREAITVHSQEVARMRKLRQEHGMGGMDAAEFDAQAVRSAEWGASGNSAELSAALRHHSGDKAFLLRRSRSHIGSRVVSFRKTKTGSVSHGLFKQLGPQRFEANLVSGPIVVPSVPSVVRCFLGLPTAAPLNQYAVACAPASPPRAATRGTSPTRSQQPQQPQPQPQIQLPQPHPQPPPQQPQPQPQPLPQLQPQAQSEPQQPALMSNYLEAGLDAPLLPFGQMLTEPAATPAEAAEAAAAVSAPVATSPPTRSQPPQPPQETHRQPPQPPQPAAGAASVVAHGGADATSAAAASQAPAQLAPAQSDGPAVGVPAATVPAVTVPVVAVPAAAEQKEEPAPAPTTPGPATPGPATPGPATPDATPPMDPESQLSNVEFKRRYFHSIKMPESASKLRGNPAGTFLFRPSSKQGYFTLDFVIDGRGSIANRRIKLEGEQFTLVAKSRTLGSLYELVRVATESVSAHPRGVRSAE